jgi:tripartite ATP-independent transporter DctM subunit
MTVAVLAGVFLLLLLLRVPVAFGIGLAALAAMLLDLPFEAGAVTLTQRTVTSAFTFTLLAIPLFILSGKLLAAGGVARRLVAFARAAVGWLPGGLAVTNVFANLLFGSITGSAAATTSGIGGFMIPAMKSEGYPRGFAAALTATAATAGLLLPPSNVLIVYAMVAGGVSVGALFLSGYLPGFLLCLLLVVIASIMSRAGGYGQREAFPGIAVLLRAFVGILPSFLLLAIVIGGIVGGLFTATEASAIAVLYAFVLVFAVYREASLKDLPRILRETASTTGMVFLLIGTSVAIAWVFAYADVPDLIADALGPLREHPWLLLLAINILLLAVGTFLDVTPGVLIFTPIFLPLMMGLAPEFGLTPDEMRYHFGVVMVFNLCLGLVSPPAGTTLFIGASIAQCPLHEMNKPLIPIFGTGIIALMIVSYWTDLTLWLPRQLGLLP